VIVADFNVRFLDLAVAIKVTIPSLFSGEWRWNVYGISRLALQAAEYGTIKESTQLRWSAQIFG